MFSLAAAALALLVAAHERLVVLEARAVHVVAIFIYVAPGRALTHDLLI